MFVSLIKAFHAFVHTDFCLYSIFVNRHVHNVGGGTLPEMVRLFLSYRLFELLYFDFVWQANRLFSLKVQLHNEANLFNHN